MVRNHASTLALSRTVKNAELVSAEIPDAAFDLLRTGDVDAFASVRPSLMTYLSRLLGSRVLDDCYGSNVLSMVVASNRASGMARRPGGVAGNIWLRLSPVWVRHGCLSLAPFCRANRLRPPARLKTKDLQYLVIENPLICSCGASTAGRAAPRDPGSSRKRPSSRRRSPARARGNRRARGAPAAACPLIVSSI